MPRPTFQLCLLSDDPAHAAFIVRDLPLQNAVVHVSLSMALGTSALEELGEPISEVSAAIVAWDGMIAPEIGTLSHRFRERGIPVLALCEDEESEVLALTFAADRVVTLPLDVPRLRAMVAAHRRAYRSVSRPTAALREPTASDADTPGITLKAGGITVDVQQHRAYIAGHALSLPLKQFDLLAYLVRQAGQLVTRDELLRDVWRIDFDPATNVVDVYICYLRRILVAHGMKGALETIRGKGFRLNT